MSPPLLTLVLFSTSVLSLPDVTIKEKSTESPYIVVEDGKTTSPSVEDDHTCSQVFANNGLNFSSFWHGAAHGIHSLYLEEIREFFEPEASENNRIPVVNEDLSAENPILFDSPLAGYDEDFKTMALKVMAYFMLNDKPDFATQGVNTLEKITHQYHMHEIYAAASTIYTRMKENPPKDTELCPCVNDIIANGILKELVNIANQLKYFNSKRRPRSRFNSRRGSSSSCLSSSRKYRTYENCDGNKFKYREYERELEQRKKRSTEDDITPEMITELEQLYLANSTQENADNLLEVSPWIPNTLEGPQQWISYEAMLTTSMLDEKELNDFAVFMFCKLNQPGLDHPSDLFE